jgi:hypothetical protein
MLLFWMPESQLKDDTDAHGDIQENT